MLWTIAVARLVFGPAMNIQAPPNLSPGLISDLIAAGINDWGGVSPVTPDHVNPEAPWPEIERLRARDRAAGKCLVERLADLSGLCARGGALARSGDCHGCAARRPMPRACTRDEAWAPGRTA